MVETDSATVAIQRHIIERPRLIGLLEGAKERVILLTAPAGYGKTTLARQWSHRRPRVIWCSCTSAVGDPAALALMIAREIEGFAPEDARRIRTFLRASQGGIDMAVLADRIVSRMRAWPEGTWVFIDDYHLVPPTSGGAELVASLTADAPLPVMIASRVRPEWSSRAVLYGDALELDSLVLTMTEEEVRQVLSHRKGKEVGWFTANAGGWPAIVGLASLTTAELPPRWSGEIHDYFAREVFALLSPAAQKGILRLALAPLATREVVSELLASSSDFVLREGLDQGFLTPVDNQAYVIHPLLLSFLREHPDYPAQESETVDRLISRLVDLRAWDLAFAVLTLHGRHDSFTELVWAGVDDLLQKSRTRTLSAWVAYARRLGLVDASIDYAQSHVLLREGHHVRALQLAIRASEQSPDNSHRHAAALVQAGWALYLSNRVLDAQSTFQEARALRTDDKYALEGLWGELMCALFRADVKALSLMREFEESSGRDAARELRVATANLRAGEVFGELTSSLVRGEMARDYLVACDDPMIQSSYLIMLSVALALNAQYARADQFLTEAMTLCEDAGLAFARSQLLIARVLVDFGLRRFAHAAATLDRLEAANLSSPDPWSALMAASLRARLSATGVLRMKPEAVAIEHTIEPTVQSEYEVSLALLYVVDGQISRGLELLSQAEGQNTSAESRCLSAWVKAIATTLGGYPEGEQLTRDAMAVTVSTGNLDSLVRAYRACPELLGVLAADQTSLRILEEVMVRARDQGLARSAGINLTPLAQKRKLTNRESEILALVAEGLTNPQIGKRLFISPVTVKVHLRHAYEKLGVRSRTEAALRASADHGLGDLGQGGPR